MSLQTTDKMEHSTFCMQVLHLSIQPWIKLVFKLHQYRTDANFPPYHYTLDNTVVYVALTLY